MGSDMANTVKAGKSSNSNLKVPPLKIVLNSHQNNSSAVVNTHNQDEDDQSEIRPKSEQEYIVGTGGETGEKHVSRKNSRSSPDRKESDQAPTASKGNSNSSRSSSNTGSDRSTSTSPSSESESLDSNLTIISDNHQTRVKSEHRDETHSSKPERGPRHNVRHEKSSNSYPQSGRSRPEEHESTSANKEQSSNSNQRITRSSQRAAQQNKTDSQGEMNNDESTAPESQEKTVESARKVKRRKGEQQETEQDNGQQANQQPLLMANICPADYQLPSQNSFELYRDIRKRPYRKMLQLNHVQPKVPQGFKDYLLNSGPYLLDGNRLGVGFSASIINSTAPNSTVSNGSNISASSRVPLRIKLSNLQSKSSSCQGLQQRHNSYLIPKLQDAPKSLRIGSPLHELFHDQEKARHQMRMQHLKERERSVLAAEQEILRAYNRVAIADNRQDLHLSACTYFYYQERYHYIDDTLDSNRQNKSKEIPHNQDNSNLCIDAPNTMSVEDQKNNGSPGSNSSRDKSTDADSGKSSKGDVANREEDSRAQKGSEETAKDQAQTVASSSEVPCDTTSVNTNTDSKQDDGSKIACEDKVSMQVDEDDADKADQQSKPTTDVNMEPVDGEKSSADMSDTDLKVLNKSVFLNQLQEIDDKWAKIKREMFIRHKNESDSLYAVQSLEWEWKAKEIGACDVRVNLKIEPEYVPRVEVSDLDY